MKSIIKLFSVCLLLTLTAVSSLAADQAYVNLKGGIFLPNGKGTGGTLDDPVKQGGLKDFDAGYNLEVAYGFRPASYVAIEVGTGFFSSSRDTSSPSYQEKATAYGVPLNVTAKALMQLGHSEVFAGAGAGYYFGLLKRDAMLNNTSISTATSHGNALGYHVVGGFDYSLGNHWSAGAEIKWFNAKPEFDDLNGSGKKIKWDFGGTAMNVGVKYGF